MSLPGQRGGRAPGVPNKLTKTIREAIIESFERVGGADWLEKLAAEDPKTYGQLLAKAMPTQVEGAGGGPVVVRIVTSVPDPAGDDDGLGPADVHG